MESSGTETSCSVMYCSLLFFPLNSLKVDVLYTVLVFIVSTTVLRLKSYTDSSVARLVSMVALFAQQYH